MYFMHGAISLASHCSFPELSHAPLGLTPTDFPIWGRTSFPAGSSPLPQPHSPSFPRPYSILYFTTWPLLRPEGRGNHATLMSEGLGLDRASWGAALGTEREERWHELCPTDGEGEVRRGQRLAQVTQQLRSRPRIRGREGSLSGSPKLEDEETSFLLQG